MPTQVYCSLSEHGERKISSEPESDIGFRNDEG
jgi:hypothetical protein